MWDIGETRELRQNKNNAENGVLENVEVKENNTKSKNFTSQ